MLKDLFFNNKTLKVVSLNNCHIGESGASQVSRGIGFSPTLKSLSLASNDMGDEGAEYFLEPFFMNTLELNYFNLSNNQISDKGGIKLIKGLMCNRSLSVIDLRHNSLSDKTA